MRWVAPSAGIWQFSASATGFSPILYVDRGPACGGERLQCNTNAQGGYPAQVSRWLDLNQIITLTVDGRTGAAGEFTLNATKLTGTCPSRPRVTTALTNVSLTDATGTKLLTPSCDWGGNMTTGPHPYPEHTYPVRIQLTPLQPCSYTIQGDGDYRVYLIRGTKCDGPEVRCFAPGPDEFILGFTNADNGDYVLAIENQDPFSQPLSYSLATDCP
jgi:hypothetical protein